MAKKSGESKREDIVRQIQASGLTKQEARKFRALANKGYDMDWAAGQARVRGGGTYTVKPGESWYSIAGDVYGDQRFFEQLMSANYGGYPLQPGAKITLPRLTGESPTVSYDAMVRSLQLDQKAGIDVSADVAKLSEYIASTNPKSGYGVKLDEYGTPQLYRASYPGGEGTTDTGVVGGGGTELDASASVQPSRPDVRAGRVPAGGGLSTPGLPELTGLGYTSQGADQTFSETANAAAIAVGNAVKEVAGINTNQGAVSGQGRVRTAAPRVVGPGATAGQQVSGQSATARGTAQPSISPEVMKSPTTVDIATNIMSMEPSPDALQVLAELGAVEPATQGIYGDPVKLQLLNPKQAGVAARSRAGRRKGFQRSGFNKRGYTSSGIYPSWRISWS